MNPKTRQLLDDLSQLAWFSAVGQPIEETYADDIIVLTSWKEACKCCGSNEHSNFQLEQQNIVTSFLHDYARERYRRWNEIVIAIKEIVAPMLDQKLDPILESLDLPERVRHTVSWDVVSACMELEYSDIREPGYALGLTGWYLQGRFPCGWGGIDDRGKIFLAEMEPLLDPNDPDYLMKAINWPVFSLSKPIHVPEGRLILY